MNIATNVAYKRMMWSRLRPPLSPYYITALETDHAKTLSTTTVAIRPHLRSLIDTRLEYIRLGSAHTANSPHMFPPNATRCSQKALR